MTSTSTTQALAGSSGGGLPTPAPVRRSATVTVTRRDGDQITVSTWDTCTGVAEFVTTLLGPPAARTTTGGTS
ncbi:hypothetical protein [Microbispora sp. NPDC049633]|uniref:hypothetical protein n=1 Tax=Microbispora sp. NPDC049633 TaxID=3154355 RepID=UPI003445831C